MKKIIFLSIAVATLFSCAKDQVLTQDKEVIGFADAFVENATKAIDGSFSNANMPASFKVYGTTTGDETGAATVAIFNGVSVEKSGNVWNYADQYTQYWIDGNTYAFAAVVNGTIADDKTISYTADGQTDLLYAANSYGEYTKGTSATTVPFIFSHLLSKVQFTVKNTMTTNTAANLYTYRVTGFQIANACVSGVYDVTKYGSTADAWTESSTTAPVYFGNADVADALSVGKVGGADEGTSQYARLLVPAAYNALNVKCTIETLLNGNVVDVENYDAKVECTLAEGKAYNFVISKGNPGEKIEFTVNPMTDWANGTI